MEIPEKCPYCGGTMENGYEWINTEEVICSKCYENLEEEK